MSRPSRFRDWALLLVGLPFAAVGVIAVACEPTFGPEWAMGLLCTLLFGAAAARGTWRLVPRRTPLPDIHLAATFRINVSIAKTLSTGLLGLLLTALSIVLVGASGWTGAYRLAGILGLLVFAPATVAAAFLAWRGGPALEIGPEGIRVWRMQGLVVPWAKVAAIREVWIEGQALLCFDIPDWPAMAPKQSWARHPAVALNTRLGYPPLALTANGLGISAPALTAIITAYATAAGVPVFAAQQPKRRWRCW